MAFPDGWAGYAECTLPNPASALTDFTYLVSLNQMPADWWTAVLSAGGDLVVTDGSNNRLAIDIIDFTDSGSSGSGLVAVKFSPSDSGTQKLRLWIGKSGESQPAAGDSFGQYSAYASHVKGFYPYGGGNDRTGNANNLTMAGSPTVGGTAGPINGSKATDYNGSSQYGHIGSFSAVTGTPLVLFCSGSADTLSPAANMAAVSLSDTGTVNNYFLQLWRGLATGDPIAAQVDGSGGAQASNSGAGYRVSTWEHVSAIFSSSTNRYVIVNGTASTPNTVSSTPSGIDSFSIAVRRDTGSGINYFDGKISLAGICNVALSDSWIAYHHAMLADPDQSDFFGSWSWVPTESESITDNTSPILRHIMGTAV